jgi:3-oxo-5alpha-steroid 4-dehydrogenase
MSSDDKELKGATRREFVKKAAIGAAALTGAGVLAACTGPAGPAGPAGVGVPGAAGPAGPAGPAGAAAPTAVPAAACPQPWLPAKWDKEVDVVVVGFGGAGGFAAIEAHDAGAKVIILEKTSTPGGDTTRCGGIILAAGTSVQKAEGISDTPDEMYKYWMAAGKGLSSPDKVRVIADRSAEVVEWLIGRGVVFKPLSFTGAEEENEYTAITPAKKRGHTATALTLGQITWPYPPASFRSPTGTPPAGGSALFKCLWDGVTKSAIEVLLETRAMELLIDPIRKHVLGVKAESKGTTLYIKARRGVVLGSGGFSHDKEMVLRYCPDALQSDYSNKSATGDGHKMGMAVGAGLVNMNRASLAVAIGKVFGSGREISIPAGSIMVSFGGRRFIAETAYRVPGEVAGGYSGKPVFAIFDKDIQVKANLPEPEASLGKMVQAPTIRELAVKKGMDPAVLEDTVNDYNEYVKLGKDPEFGRRAMVPIKTPPFYAVDAKVTSTSVCLGGLTSNTKAQVIDVFGKVIPRLYAAGSVGGGSLGLMYPASGSAIADAFVFGRIAGANAAAETAWS